MFDRDYVYQFNENVDFERIQKACFLLQEHMILQVLTQQRKQRLKIRLEPCILLRPIVKMNYLFLICR